MSGLGRWVWQTVEGHSDTKLVIIQIYRPVRNEKDKGSTFMQQRVAADEEDPTKIFNADLLTLVDGFLEDNFQIVIYKGRSKVIHYSHSTSCHPKMMT